MIPEEVGDWCCEPALWTKWVHVGTMRSQAHSEVGMPQQTSTLEERVSKKGNKQDPTSSSGCRHLAKTPSVCCYVDWLAYCSRYSATVVLQNLFAESSTPTATVTFLPLCFRNLQRGQRGQVAMLDLVLTLSTIWLALYPRSGQVH